MSSRRPAPRLRRFPDTAALAAAVADAVDGAVRSGVAARGRASLVFSGGSTPAAFLPAVAELALPWEQVTVLLADERWVPETSAESNASLLRRGLLSAPGPSRARFVPLWNDATEPGQGAAAARAALPPEDTPYDLVLLGMGNDGHFASLFPGSPRLAALLAADGTERVAAVPAPTTAAPALPRLTLTLAELLRSRRLLLVLQSERKLEVLGAAFEAGDPLATPVVALGEVEVLWCP